MVKLKLTLTLTDTGGAVLTLMLGYRSLVKIASRILNTTPINSTDFIKVLGSGLVLASKHSRVHNLKLLVVRVFLYCASYS